MMPSLTFEKVVSDCELLKGALEPLLGDMPHLNGENTKLEAFLSEVKSLRQQQKELTGRLREVVRLRREAEARGQRALADPRLSHSEGGLGLGRRIGLPPWPSRRWRRARGNVLAGGGC